MKPTTHSQSGQPGHNNPVGTGGKHVARPRVHHGRDEVRFGGNGKRLKGWRALLLPLLLAAGLIPATETLARRARFETFLR